MKIADLRRAFGRHDMENMSSMHEPIWLVHFTFAEAAKSICANGFLQGTPETGRVDQTWGSDYDQPGINYAFNAADEASIMSATTFCLSSEAVVMFKASGLSMKHYDGFYQVAFWGPHAVRPFYGIRPIDEVDHTHTEIADRLWQIFAINDKVMNGPKGDLWTLMTLIENGRV